MHVMNIRYLSLQQDEVLRIIVRSLGLLRQRIAGTCLSGQLRISLPYDDV